jgi:hypothetical protein
VFSKSHPLSVYLEAYEQGAVTTRPLLAFVSLYRERKKVFETAPIEVTNSWTNSVKTMPLQFNIPLGTLAAGKYDCQVSVLDPTGQKAAFWQAPVEVVP